MTIIIVCIAAFVVACIIADLLIFALTEDDKERWIWMVGSNVLFFIIAAVVFALFFFRIDDREAQEAWIVNELPDKIWEEQVVEMTNDEYRRICSVLESHGESAAKKYSDGEKEQSENMHLFASLLGAGELFSLLDDTESRTKKQIDVFSSHVSDVSKRLGRCMINYAYELKDEKLRREPGYSNSDISAMLIGTPVNMAYPSDYTISMVAYTLVNNMLAGSRKPSVSSFEYDYLYKYWYVSMDNAPDETVRFNRRFDGKLEANWDDKKEIVRVSDSSSLSGSATAAKSSSQATAKKSRPSNTKSSASETPYNYKGSFLDEKGMSLDVEMTILTQNKESKDGTMPVRGHYRYVNGRNASQITFTGSFDPAKNKLLLLTDSGTEKFYLTYGRNKGLTGSRYKFRSRSDRDKGEAFTKQYKVTLKAE